MYDNGHATFSKWRSCGCPWVSPICSVAWVAYDEVRLSPALIILDLNSRWCPIFWQLETAEGNRSDSLQHRHATLYVRVIWPGHGRWNCGRSPSFPCVSLSETLSSASAWFVLETAINAPGTSPLDSCSTILESKNMKVRLEKRSTVSQKLMEARIMVTCPHASTATNSTSTAEEVTGGSIKTEVCVKRRSLVAYVEGGPWRSWVPSYKWYAMSLQLYDLINVITSKSMYTTAERGSTPQTPCSSVRPFKQPTDYVRNQLENITRSSEYELHSLSIFSCNWIQKEKENECCFKTSSPVVFVDHAGTIVPAL